MTEIDTRGDNSGADDKELAAMLDEEDGSDNDTVTVGGVAGERLRSFIQRVERLEEEKKTIADDVREVYVEAKSNGFDPKIMRLVVKRRKREKADVQEEEALLDTYLAALGMLD